MGGKLLVLLRSLLPWFASLGSGTGKFSVEPLRGRRIQRARGVLAQMRRDTSGKAHGGGSNWRTRMSCEAAAGELRKRLVPSLLAGSHWRPLSAASHRSGTCYSPRLCPVCSDQSQRYFQLTAVRTALILLVFRPCHVGGWCWEPAWGLS